jgi:hypothetical protein
MDKDSKRTIHFAILLFVSTDCDRDVEIQSKLTKVY